MTDCYSSLRWASKADIDKMLKEDAEEEPDFEEKQTEETDEQDEDGEAGPDIDLSDWRPPSSDGFPFTYRKIGGSLTRSNVAPIVKPDVEEVKLEICSDNFAVAI